jgi:hypothetical protein
METTNPAIGSLSIGRSVGTELRQASGSVFSIGNGADRPIASSLVKAT